MSDTTSNFGKNKVLSLKGKPGTVRQSFSHGRSKSVVVETKRKRLIVPKNKENPFEKPVSPNEKSQQIKPGEVDLEKSNLSDVEVSRRVKALEAARALETSRLEQEKRTLETSKKELAEIQEKGPDNTTKKASLIAPEKNDSLEINVNLAGPLPSEIPLMDAPVTKPRVNKQEEPQKKTR